MPEKLTELVPDIEEQILNEEEKKKLENSAASQILKSMSVVKKEKVKCTLRLSGDTYEKFARICSARGISINSVLSNLVFQYIQDNQEYLK